MIVAGSRFEELARRTSVRNSVPQSRQGTRASRTAVGVRSPTRARKASSALARVTSDIQRRPPASTPSIWSRRLGGCRRRDASSDSRSGERRPFRSRSSS